MQSFLFLMVIHNSFKKVVVPPQTNTILLNIADPLLENNKLEYEKIQYLLSLQVEKNNNKIESQNVNITLADIEYDLTVKKISGI